MNASTKGQVSRMKYDAVKVGIAGLGRSGWNIHAKTMLGLRDQFEIVAVADNAAERRSEATAPKGCHSSQPNRFSEAHGVGLQRRIDFALHEVEPPDVLKGGRQVEVRQVEARIEA